MQNKQYTIQFFPTVWWPIAQPVPEQWLWISQNLWILQSLQISLNSQKRSNLQKTYRKKGSCPPDQPPFINGAWRPWHGIFLLAILGSLPGRAPSQLLHSCSSTEHGKLKNVLDFLVCHCLSAYDQHFSRTKSKTQQLLGLRAQSCLTSLPTIWMRGLRAPSVSADTKLGGSVDLLEGRKALQSYTLASQLNQLNCIFFFFWAMLT